MDTNGLVTRCAENILGMLSWRKGDPRGEGEQDRVVRLDEEALAEIERMEFDLETAHRQGDEGNGGEKEIPERNEWPEGDCPEDWRRHLDRENLPRRITTAPSNVIWLGRYFPMAPWGVIQLHQERLGYFFWKLMAKLLRRHAITAQQLGHLAEATVLKTLIHEAFHHRSDLVRLLHGDNNPGYSPLVEEALAVASSWHYLRLMGLGWHMPDDLWDGFITEAYRYTGAGYRDWKEYRGFDFFLGFQQHALSPRAIAVLLERDQSMFPPSMRGRHYRLLQRIFSLYPGRYNALNGFDWPLPHWLPDSDGFFAPEISMHYLETRRVRVEVVVSSGKVVDQWM